MDGTETYTLYFEQSAIGVVIPTDSDFLQVNGIILLQDVQLLTPLLLEYLTYCHEIDRLTQMGNSAEINFAEEEKRLAPDRIRGLVFARFRWARSSHFNPCIRYPKFHHLAVVLLTRVHLIPGGRRPTDP